MNTQFTFGATTLRLHRWPLSQPNHSLQAWDAADELILEQALPLYTALQATQQHPVRLLILNDAFGALSCAMSAAVPEATVQYLVQDSVLSQQACRHNRVQNDLSSNQIVELSSLAPLPAAPQLVLFKLPANHSYLAFQLAALSKVLTAESTLLVAAKAKDINRNVLALFAQFIGPTQASLTIKKCRYIETTFQAEQPKPELNFPLRWPLDDSHFVLVNHANVFAREKLDIGARFFLQHLPTVAANSTVVDLGCGNGVLSLQLLQQQPACQLVLCDESYMAVASAQASIAENLPEQLSQCQFVADDCLTQQADNSADWVICNPPFHQQTAVTTHIASQMFRDAKRVLKTGGRLRIVANRHLPYRLQLEKLFGHCQQLAANPKFVILESIKRS